MKAVIAFCLFALLATSTVAQTDFFDVIVIDPFDLPSDILVVVVGVTPSNSLSTFTTGVDILGGERDLELSGFGNDNQVLSAGVSGGDFTCAAPNGAQGQVILQYDGEDGSLNVDGEGLFGEADNNFRSQGGFAFRVQMETDISTVVTFNVYTGADICTVTVTVPGGDELIDFVIEYDEFTQNCDFSNVGAFEIDVDLAENVDIVIRQIATYAPFTEDVCICPPCPEFSCVMIFEADDNGMFYYVTSDFDDGDTFSNTNSMTPNTMSNTNSMTPNTMSGRSPRSPGSPDSPNSPNSPFSSNDCSSATTFTFSGILLLASVIYALL